MEQNIKAIIQSADLVLVGIGEEFEGVKYLKQIPEYVKLREKAEATGKEWLIPSLNRFFAQKAPDEFYFRLTKALTNLVELLQHKNYFLVTVTTNDFVWDAGFKEGRVVAPCGGSRKKQCIKGQECAQSPIFLSAEEQEEIEKCIQSGNLDSLNLGNCIDTENCIDTGKCIDTGNCIDTEKCMDLGDYVAPESSMEPKICTDFRDALILNNIYTENYDERGYLDQWQIYTKWLQGTLNKKLCILELGVGMQCPSVIRFPFEKIGYFNQKANFIRVNQNLYQLTEELKEKGISISENAVDWLTSMW